jgi:urease accessory protein
MNATAESVETGRLDLVFARDPDGRTFIARQYAGYPFHVCRALYADSELPGVATLYTQSSAGGLYDGDRLAIDVAAEAGAQVHLTTQASTIIHRGRAAQDARLTAGAGSLLEYVPDPTILFPDSDLQGRLDIALHDSACVILGDSFIAHDPDGDGRPFGTLDNRTRVTDAAGTVRVLDRFQVGGMDWADGKAGRLGRHAAQGTLMVLAPARPPITDALRAALTDRPGLYAGASDLPNATGAWLRLIATDGATLKSAMTIAWSAAREALTGHIPAARRK